MTLLLDDSKKKIGNKNSLCLCNGDSIMKSPVKMKENEDFSVHVQKGRLFIIGVIVSNFRMPGVYACWIRKIFSKKSNRKGLIVSGPSTQSHSQSQSSYLLIDIDPQSFSKIRQNEYCSK